MLEVTAENKQPPVDCISVTVKRASEITGIGPTKLYELLAAGAISGTKIGGRRLLHFASLKKLIIEAA